MKWSRLRRCAWVDTRARFVAATPAGGTLLDLGSSDGQTLTHIAELRPDLRLLAVDREGTPERYPRGCEFQRADLERDQLPWPPGSVDAITCMHLVEHLRDPAPLVREAARLLKAGGRIFYETPAPKTVALPSPRGAALGVYALNFYDDRSHVRVVTPGALAQMSREAGLEVMASGTSRNWLFAASYPFSVFLPSARMRFAALTNWIGWSVYLIARRPQ